MPRRDPLRAGVLRIEHDADVRQELHVPIAIRSALPGLRVTRHRTPDVTCAAQKKGTVRTASVSSRRGLPFPRAAPRSSTLGVPNMATTTRGELRLLVEQLADEELDAARDALRRLAKRYDDRDIPEYHRRLLEEGIIDRIPDPNGPRRGRRFKPIRIKGKPVSETIIEDRR